MSYIVYDINLHNYEITLQNMNFELDMNRKYPPKKHFFQPKWKKKEEEPKVEPISFSEVFREAVKSII